MQQHAVEQQQVHMRLLFERSASIHLFRYFEQTLERYAFWVLECVLLFTVM